MATTWTRETAAGEYIWGQDFQPWLYAGSLWLYGQSATAWSIISNSY